MKREGRVRKMKNPSATVAAIASILMIAGCASTGPDIPDFREVVSAAKEAVFPSLVYVRVVTEGVSDGKIEKMQASGSGVIITEDGEFLTNHHVIDKATRIRCQLTDGRMYDAKLVGKDKDLDVALLKIESADGEKFPAAELSPRRLEVGEVVLAMGAPWGLARSVSMGIVSCNDRYLENCGDYTLWYQTDAAISPGNSGGPLVDTNGKVVGLNARGNTMGAQAFTIPSTTVLEVLPNLRKHGNAHWTWFGMDWQPLNDFERDTFFAATNGVVVSGVDPQGPARKAGLEANDRIVSIDGESVTAVFREDIPRLNRRLGLSDPDRETVFEYVRNGESRTVSVRPVPKGGVEGAEREFKRWGFVAKEINRFDTPDLAFFAPTGGVFVLSVSWDGNADNAGLKPRDIIKKWGGVEIASIDALGAEYDKAVSNLAVRTQAGVEVLRKGHPLRFVLNYRDDPDKDETDKD